MGAKDETLAALAEANRLYEARFGHVFLISAEGRTAEDVLEALLQRLDNDPSTEIKVAAEQQRKIMRLPRNLKGGEVTELNYRLKALPQARMCVTCKSGNRRVVAPWSPSLPSVSSPSSPTQPYSGGKPLTNKD